MAGKRCLSIAAIRGARQVASPQARCPQVRARLLGANLGSALGGWRAHLPAPMAEIVAKTRITSYDKRG
jgi:hypothetical protein